MRPSLPLQNKQGKHRIIFWGPAAVIVVAGSGGSNPYLNVAPKAQREEAPLRYIHVRGGRLGEVGMYLLVRSQVPDPGLSSPREENSQKREKV